MTPAEALDPVIALAIAAALIIGVPGLVAGVGALLILRWEYRK